VELVSVFAPGSASNLGPGFDCLGLAFTGRGDRVTARGSATPGIHVLSVSDQRIPTDPARNTAAIAAAAVLRRVTAARAPGAGGAVGLELTVEKGLPLAGGMGGSAASAVAGAVAADRVLGAGLAPLDLLDAALEAESVVAGRHADNVAPSLLGGAVLVCGLDPPRLTRFRIHPSLAVVLVTPAYQVETAKARAVLPREIPRADAIAQAAHLGALVLALERGDADLIRSSMVDRIAEPARTPLYPGYLDAKSAALEAGAAGVAVSGAGPTVLALAAAARSEAVAAAIVEAYRRCGIESSPHVAEVDTQGARVVPS
jgi:homoserine kinase